MAAASRTSTLARAVRHLEAGEWKAAHALIQPDESTLGCWAHGIVHLQEGDIDNARYWYRRARRSPPEGDDIAAEVAALKAAVKEEDR